MLVQMRKKEEAVVLIQMGLPDWAAPNSRGAHVTHDSRKLLSFTFALSAYKPLENTSIELYASTPNTNSGRWLMGTRGNSPS